MKSKLTEGNTRHAIKNYKDNRRPIAPPPCPNVSCHKVNCNFYDKTIDYNCIIKPESDFLKTYKQCHEEDFLKWLSDTILFSSICSDDEKFHKGEFILISHHRAFCNSLRYMESVKYWIEDKPRTLFLYSHDKDPEKAMSKLMKQLREYYYNNIIIKGE